MPTWRPGTSSSTLSDAERRSRRSGEGGRLDGDAALLLLASGALAFAAGVRTADSGEGFSLAQVLGAIGRELPVTLPAAVGTGAAWVANLAAGAVVVRLVRHRPFGSWSDLVLGGFAGAVLLDCLLMFALGGLGLFRQGVLAAALLVVFVVGVGVRPLVAVPFRPFGRGRVDEPGRPDLARWLLVGLVWCGPVIVALASPVVPAADVLPNHVAPAEHLRVFGAIASLAAYPSPIYGASRLFLGYSALMGTLSTLTGLPAALAVAASTGSLIVVSAVSVRRLASAAFGREAGFWALLAFPLSFTFVRLPDVRDSVVALPLAALALALMATPAFERRARRVPARPDWLLAVALTAATLVHPLVGALAAGTIAVVTIADPGRYARRAIPALVATAIACLPQLAVMIGLAPWPVTGLVAFAAAALAAVLTARAIDPVAGALITSRAPAAGSAAGLTIGLATVGTACLALILLFVPGALGQAAQSLNLAFPVLFGTAILAAFGLVPTSRGGRRLLLASLAVGGAALLAMALIPDTSLVAASLRYEIPKAVGYWLPWACVPAAGALCAGVARWNGARWNGARWNGARVTGASIVRVPLIGVFLAIVLIPFGPPLPDSAQASHPVADVLAHDLQTAGQGYWQGYPDARLVVDATGGQVLEFLRGEIGAGRLGAESQLLHVAASYQESASLPIGAFTGIEETIVSADATTNIFTAGGRIQPLTDLAVELRAEFAYVVLEPAGLPVSTRAEITAAGFRSVFVNASAEVFAASP